MKTQEAIEILESMKYDHTSNSNTMDSIAQASEMAIGALRNQSDVPDTNVGDMISRQATIDALEKHEKSNGHNYTLFVDIVSECEEIIREIPSAQPDIARDIATIIENEKDMRVILTSQPEGKKGCKVCGEAVPLSSNFCLHCGTDMRGKE